MEHLVCSKSAHRVGAMLLALLVAAIVIARFGASASSGLPASRIAIQAEQSKDAITVRAAKRGNPRMNLQDGRSAAANYKDATTHAASTSLSGARPLSLASGDANGDGFPDLV